MLVTPLVMILVEYAGTIWYVTTTKEMKRMTWKDIPKRQQMIDSLKESYEESTAIFEQEGEF